MFIRVGARRQAPLLPLGGGLDFPLTFPPGKRWIDTLVETGRDNAAALAVYRRAGFVETNLVHLTLGLADPTHAP